jgi:competence protein ComEC
MVMVFISQRKTDLLRVTFFDIGQGDAIYIKSPSGAEMLVDGGADTLVLEKLGKYMSIFDRQISVVVATHPDKDHIGGLPSVLSRYDVGLLLESGAGSDNGVQDELDRIAEKKNVQKKVAYSTQRIELGDGVVATVLYPNKSILGLETNDASIVLLLEYKNKNFLLTGDASIEIERDIIENIPELTVLKAGHHGSQTSTSFELLEKTTPEFVVISAGRNNSYGHPHTSVLKLINSFKSTVLRTDTDGDITFVTDGESLTVKRQINSPQQ